MSLPDATRSDRVYPLLQNLDLENLAFATLQGTGETLNIEEMNEDELRRLVLINLARLTVKGEWDGLLSAGGGGAATFSIAGISGVSYGVTQSGYGQTYRDQSSTTRLVSDFNTPAAFPFIAQAAGNMSKLTIYVSASGTGTDFLAGIYTNVNGAPSALIGSATFDLAATGFISQTSFSATITLEAGTAYWIVFGNTGAAGSETVRRLSSPPQFGIIEDDSYEYSYQGWTHSGTTTALPATFVATAGRYFRPLAYYSVS